MKGIISPKGQIQPGSAFGDLLTVLARNAETIVEVGTWHGMGSTQCLALGLVRPTQLFWTIEQDPACHAEAKGYYNDPRITFLRAHTLDVLDQLPGKIDLLLLDGDDLATDREWDALQGRTRMVALDDTLHRKNARQRELLNHPDWVITHDVRHERNGWMVACRSGGAGHCVSDPP